MTKDFLKQYHSSLQKEYKVKLKKNRLLAFSHRSKKYCSIQLLQTNQSPLDLARTYFQWLEKSSKKIITAKEIGEKWALCFLHFPLLTLKLVGNHETKATFKVVGGALAKQEDQGTFTFIHSTEGTIVALEHFSPRLPWWLYFITQAPIHEFVMVQFQKQFK